MKPDTKRNEAGDKLSGLFQRLYAKSNLLALIMIVMLFGQVPLLANFLSWQMTFFHEISHGLAALLTGGRLVRIELSFSGAGVCYSRGGLWWIISLAGYIGAAFWGLLIYLSAESFSQKRSHILAIVLVAVLAASAVFYARDLPTWIIISVITAFYAGAIKFRQKLPLKLFLKLAGLYIMLDALKAPMALLGHQSPNDAANLAAQTGLPAITWIALWLGVAALCLVFIWKIERRPERLRPDSQD